MSDTNRVGLTVARKSDSVFPVAGNFSFQNLRITGTPNLAYAPQTIVSNEIRSDRQITDLIPVGADAGGDTGFEWSYGVVDTILESALFSTWANTKVATPTSGAMGAGTIPFAATAGFKVGQLIKLLDPSVAPASFAASHGVYEITTVTTNTSIAVSPFPGATFSSLLTNPVAISASFSSGASTTVKVVGYYGATADVAATAAGLTSAATGFGALRGATDDLLPGHFIKIVGWTGAGVAATNSVWIQVTAQTTALLTLRVPSNWQTDAGTGQRIAIFFGDFVKNGSGLVSDHIFVVERSFNDHSPVSREAYLQMAVNQISMQMQPKSIATGSLNWFGATAKAVIETNITDLYAGTVTRVLAPSYSVYNTSSHIGRLARGANAVGVGGVNAVLDASLQLNNNLRRNDAVGFFGAASIGVGELSVTGNLNTYFDDLTLYTDLLNGTETSTDMVMRGNDGRALLVHVPRLKFTNGAPQVPGKNQSVVLPLPYQGLLDSTLNYTVSFQRFTFSV